MKMTPEQEAFFEYGRAYENFKKSYSVHQESKEKLDDRDAYKSIIVSSNRDVLKRYIKIAKQKRAACRAWTIPNHERICENCAHEGTHPLETPCLECLRNQAVYCEEGGNAGDGDYWEPRKEGE